MNKCQFLEIPIRSENTCMVRLVLDLTSILVRSDRMRTVGPYEYTRTVWTVRVRSEYAYGLEHIHVRYTSHTPNSTEHTSLRLKAYIDILTIDEQPVTYLG